MAGYNYNVGGTTYTAVESTVLHFPRRTGTDPIQDLEAYPAPGGEFGPVALVSTFAAVGTGTVSGGLYVWDGDCTAASNASTIVRPDAYATDATAGRWLRAVAWA